MRKLLDLFKLESTYQLEYKRNAHAPKYIPTTYEQDSSQSITSNGRYDLTRFSPHESAIVSNVWYTVQLKYPPEYRSMGLANESYMIKYKPRYVLFEILILAYSESQNPVDLFAVSLAYASKGAFYRNKALFYFEKSEKYITPEFMNNFLSYMPLSVYLTFSQLYEQEHLYPQAIHYAKLAGRYSDTYTSATRIKELKEKEKRNPVKRSSKITADHIQFEKDVSIAADFFLKHKYLPSNLNPPSTDSEPRKNFSADSLSSESNPSTKAPTTKPLRRRSRSINVEQYAAMCNAYLEHQDEMEQYKNIEYEPSDKYDDA